MLRHEVNTRKGQKDMFKFNATKTTYVVNKTYTDMFGFVRKKLNGQKNIN